MKRSRFALAALVLSVAALTGCARGSNDYFDRTADEFELHVKKFYNQVRLLHEDTDRYFFDFQDDDPNLGFRDWGTEY